MALSKKTIRDLDLTGKRVLMRCDFNVPLDGDRITDDIRITASLPTIQFALEAGAKVVLCSHLGRPNGERNMKYSLAPVAKRLSELLGFDVVLAEDCIGEAAESAVAGLDTGKAVLLENVRFHGAEEDNDPEFAAQLARLADVFVNDAFGTAHRAHASTEGVAHLLPAVAGFLIEKEIDFLGKAVEDPKRPFVAIMGGAKVKDKIQVIDSLLPKVDQLVIGGGMAYTFYKAQGWEIGQSLLDADSMEYCLEVMKTGKIVLPMDTVVAPTFAADAPPTVVASNAIPSDQMGLDIGPETAQRFREIAAGAGTVLWNGPMGVFEFDAFAHGTREVALGLTECQGISIVGGGDSAAAIEKFGLADRVSHVSTGGGASLEFLEGKVLPGIAALLDA
ncbi:phosphoglycerate kinase [Armatimonadetes bacterium Uphvl-Ar1]|nr:phosphoglycerate kinase [Armatimonadetes bacterium Uphvl-Ar1]